MPLSQATAAGLDATSPSRAQARYEDMSIGGISYMIPVLVILILFLRGSSTSKHARISMTRAL